jgi:hypothetical protein
MAAALPASAGAPSRIWREATGRCSMAFRHSPLTPEDTFNNQPTVKLDLVFACRARLDNRAELLSSLCIRRVYDVDFPRQAGELAERLTESSRSRRHIVSDPALNHNRRVELGRFRH